MQCLSRRPKGLSLVQLLASMSITLILLTILITAVGRVREQAQTSNCRSNLRQLAAAGILYANDNNGGLPDRSAWTYPPPNPYSLASYLALPARDGGMPVKQDTVLTCPTIQSSAYASVSEYHRSYSINQYATGGDNSSGANAATWKDHVASRGSPQTLHGVREPSSQAFFMDGTGQPVEEGYNYSVFTAPDRLKSTPTGWHTIYIHSDSIHVSYLDGHVESVSRLDAEDGFVGPTNPGGSSYSPRILPFWGAQQ